MNAPQSIDRTASVIASRDDLSFTRRKNDEYRHLMNWVPWRAPRQIDQWGIGYSRGKGFAAEIQALSIGDEEEAYYAIQCAFNDSNWRVGGWGEEIGFAAAIAALAVVGMRALKAGAAPYDPDALEDGEEGA